MTPSGIEPRDLPPSNLMIMQDIYNYVPETSHVSRLYSVAAVLYLQSVLRVMLFLPWNAVCTFTLCSARYGRFV